MENKKPKENNAWYKRSVVYQIYPLSFKDSHADGVGDLEGIIQKLDYLNDGTKNSLGIKAIWFSPVYPSPMEDAGYDISNYEDISYLFGDLKTFDRLIFECKKRGIHVIMDLVGNHTSSRHGWFLESRASKENSKRDWYVWKDPKQGGGPPNNWLSVFGGSAWEFDKKTGQYYLHSFLHSQPDLNWRNDEVKKEMKKVMKFWIERGVDGFRVDAFYHFIEDPLYRDDPPNDDYVPGDNVYNSLRHIHSKGRVQIPEAMKIFKETLDENPHVFIVNEVYVDLVRLEEMYRIGESERYVPFNFNFIAMPWEAGVYKKFIDDFEASLRPHDTPTYVFGNHDVSRLASRVGKNRVRSAALLLLTLRGIPFIYYGDEIGMENGIMPPDSGEHSPGKPSKRVPIFNFGRDAERTPMQWDDSTFGGFSTHEPWLNLITNYKTVNVKNQSDDSKSLLSLYKTLIHFRNSSKTLQFGGYTPMSAKSKDVFMFMREYADEKLLVIINFSNKKCEESLPGKAEVICNTFIDRQTGEKISGKITLRPNEGYLLKIP